MQLLPAVIFTGRKMHKAECLQLTLPRQWLKRWKLTIRKLMIALVEAINSVDVVAKVSGSLDKVNFKEGALSQRMNRCL